MIDDLPASQPVSTGPEAASAYQAPASPPYPVSPTRAKRGWLSGAAAVILLTLGKLKYLLVLLKFGKFGATAVTMALTLALYSRIFGWAFAAGLLALIFVHEMGHALWARREGLNVGAPIFIPFMGAFIAMRELPRNVFVEAKVALAGPALGTAGAVAVYGLADMTHSELLLALAYFGFIINLFNMIPIAPLDGGRVMAIVSKWFNVLGLAIVVVFAFYRPNPILLLVLLFGALETFKRFRSPNEASYYQVPSEARVVIGLSALALIAFLVYATEVTQGLLPHLARGGLL